jgi:outer membrane protein TolC
VRRAERLVAAQSAAIGIAEANLYPAISISGSLQLEAQDFSRLFNSQAWAGNVGPLFRWNVLNYGRLVNLIRVEDARLQQLIATYQQTVLRANEEAENAIVGFLLLHERIGLLRQSVAEAQEAARVTQAKYQAGRIEFNRVFTIEQFLVSQQDQLAQSQGEMAQSLIQLYKAVGGGWELRLEEPAAGGGSFPATVPPATPLPPPPDAATGQSPPAAGEARR